MKRLVVAERVAQYGAGNYLENEIGRRPAEGRQRTTRVISRVYGIGGLNFRPDEDARPMFDLALNWPNVDAQPEDPGRPLLGRLAGRCRAISRRPP